ncbi:transcriptional regulator, LacI family [Granulicella pectinivorans]|jgi:LacI family transcriptional regulator|uniref:Transcriptional regulator, LacI family n=1 Tax=Granulicella pectinivorans TaxID=474950 RepID=A0A1I6MBQ1_9BACT|nr:LacI family DNA-binding transcriptional regulator [Granulicella pectinivorans]SFS13033.1 transcriptional regulator, LacI family [Granulicella pectinivorans]
MDIRQVAKRAKVSTATVSRVLNDSPSVREKTSAHVRNVIAEMNYVPNTHARSLRVGRARMYGLIVSDINNPFFPELIDAFEALAAQQGIDVIFMHTNYDPKRLQSCIRRMVERSVDGIAVMTSEVDLEALQMAPERVPLVLMNQPAFKDRYRNVPVEYATGFREALEHLRELGHTDIGFISGPSTLSSAKRRREEWSLAMKRLKLPVRKGWVITGDMRMEGGERAMAELMALEERPTAVLTSNDLMAVGALQAASHAGLSVPTDVSIIGFDDLPIASMVMPPLTTIQLPRREIAAYAFASLLQATRDGMVANSDVVHPTLIVRKSTAVVPPRR